MKNRLMQRVLIVFIVGITAMNTRAIEYSSVHTPLPPLPSRMTVQEEKKLIEKILRKTGVPFDQEALQGGDIANIVVATTDSPIMFMRVENLIKSLRTHRASLRGTCADICKRSIPMFCRAQRL